MTADAFRALTTFAVLAAAAACFAAVSLHALQVQAGYELARAQRDARRIERDLCEAEQALATARSPAVLRATAIALGLPVDYPRTAPEVRAEDVRFHREAAAAAAVSVVRAEPR